jgi:hypothetical protein
MIGAHGRAPLRRMPNGRPSHRFHRSGVGEEDPEPTTGGR